MDPWLSAGYLVGSLNQRDLDEINYFCQARAMNYSANQCYGASNSMANNSLAQSMAFSQASMPEPRITRALRMAAEVRLRRPEMQVKRIPIDQQATEPAQ